MAFPFGTFKLELENALWRDEQTMPDRIPEITTRHPGTGRRDQMAIKIQGNRVDSIIRRSENVQPDGAS
jgi:hypothetical protein